MKKMAVRFGDDQVASVLSLLGHHTWKGKRWSESNVATARRTYSRHGQRRAAANPGILSLTQAPVDCAVSNKTIEKLVQNGILKMEEVVPRAPWEIRRCNLYAPPVSEILHRLRRTGKLVLQGAGAELQIALPIETTGDNNTRHHV